jgi:uncharacterized membrane protein HdeD (DUF308 family)
MATAANDILDQPGRVTMFQRRWGWLLLLGIVQMICGAFALSVPVAATLAATIIFGAVMVASGVMQVVHVFSVRNWKGVILHSLSALLYIGAGVLVLLFPLRGALTLTIVVAVLLIADGVVRSMLALRVRPLDGWGWFLAAGLASIVVGVLLMSGWPITGLWAIGVLLGVNLLFSGITLSALAITFRSRMHRNERDHEDMGGAHRHA